MSALIHMNPGHFSSFPLAHGDGPISYFICKDTGCCVINFMGYSEVLLENKVSQIPIFLSVELVRKKISGLNHETNSDAASG